MRLLLVALLVGGFAQAPPFEYSAQRVTRSDLPSSWRPGCPVGPAELRRLRLSYWGFDLRAHTGTLIVHADVARDVRRVFARLYAARFPVTRMRVVDVYGGSDRRSMAADDTSAFNCRYASAPGARRWSAHAYGKAIDVNPVENPYINGGLVSPPSGAAFRDRSRVRPGMAVPGGVLVRAFDSVGWSWGGRWSGTPDYQHFSATGG
jgi:D-alanyl-D-alanine carboxypeptidase